MDYYNSESWIDYNYKLPEKPKCSFCKKEYIEKEVNCYCMCNNKEIIQVPNCNCIQKYKKNK